MIEFEGASVIVTRRVDEALEFLLLHRVGYPKDSSDWSWTPTGGAREQNETPLACAVRELTEESGLVADRAPTLVHSAPGWYFYHLEVDRQCSIQIDLSEHDEYRWSKLDETLALVNPAVVTEAMAITYAAATGRSLHDSTPLTDVGAILFDLDGTLLRNDQGASERTRTVLSRVEAMGILPVLVTARPPLALDSAVREIGIAPLAVCLNGAMVFDCARGEVVSEAVMDPATVREVIAVIKYRIPDTVLGVYSGLGMKRDAGFRPSWPEPPQTQVLAMSGYSGKSATTLLARNPAFTPAAFLERLNETVGDLVNVTTSSRTGLVEMTSNGVGKAETAFEITANHGISPIQTLAFGDMPTDYEMIRRAGYGVAVANAHPSVLEVCDLVTLSNESDGVAFALECLIPKLTQETE